VILDNSNLIALDSSVVLKWFLKKDEPDRGIALQILEDFTSGSREAIIPDLLLYEVGNRLRLEKESRLSQKTDRLLSLWDLPFLIIPLKKSLIQLALEYADRHQITYYDALFVITAFTTDCTLYTADEKLLQKVSALPYVRPLKDYAA
jgi:predicted nucleic acid-binding protein